MLWRNSSASTDLTPFNSRLRTSGVGEKSLLGVCWAVAARAAKALAMRASAAPPIRRVSGIAAQSIAKGGPRKGRRARRRTDQLRLESRQQLIVVRRVRDALDQPLHPRLRRHLAEATPQ